jgi:oxygen-independent coproporphyrinogen-3 oxidase
VPSALPAGEPAPVDGSLPAEALRDRRSRPFGVYLHVPFCATRCGYCDFNTYTASELGGGADQAAYADTLASEIALAARVLGDGPPVETVFVGGGTPTLLPAGDLVRTLAAVRDTLGLTDDAEVTTEANPESVDEAYLAELRAGGFTRVSFGMQSAAPHVLRVLERRHTPGRAVEAVAEARRAGFDHVNVDLIYGTPGETDDDWRGSLESAIGARPDHVSAYALIVEDGTRLAGQVRRGEIPMPDDDVLADRYLIADETLSQAGLHWYEVSNWASSDAARCRHNELYWRSADWWGFGPGAHSHVGGVRWWNVKHPSAYAARLASGESPAAARELLADEDRRVERVLLETRLVDGLDPGMLTEAGRKAVPGLQADGLLEEPADRLVLTLRGRLLADAVVRALLPD